MGGSVAPSGVVYPTFSLSLGNTLAVVELIQKTRKKRAANARSADQHSTKAGRTSQRHETTREPSH